jgi:hypothetical protein
MGRGKSDCLAPFRFFDDISSPTSLLEFGYLSVCFVQQPGKIQVGRVIAAGEIRRVLLQLLLTLAAGPQVTCSVSKEEDTSSAWFSIRDHFF